MISMRTEKAIPIATRIGPASNIITMTRYPLLSCNRPKSPTEMGNKQAE